MNTQPKNEQPAENKLAYTTPEIVDYGWIEIITLSGATSGSDVLFGSGIQ
jgi:hypothetical protein